jgi:hypothetical protein
MKPTPIKSFADLAGVLREVAAETPPVPNPPMTPRQVEDAARAFVEHRRAARPLPPNPLSAGRTGAGDDFVGAAVSGRGVSISPHLHTSMK